MKAVRKKMAEHWQHVSYRHPGVDFDFLTVPINAETLAGCYIAEKTSGYGMGAHVEDAIRLQTDVIATWDDAAKQKVFGNQEDLEWVYVVNAIDRSIKVFGGGYSGKPAWQYTGKTVDPMTYVENLVEECQKSEGKAITVASRSLNRFGFPVNPQRKSGRRAAHEAQRAKFHSPQKYANKGPNQRRHLEEIQFRALDCTMVHGNRQSNKHTDKLKSSHPDRLRAIQKCGDTGCTITESVKTPPDEEAPRRACRKARLSPE
jgi:hypothetical protein